MTRIENALRVIGVIAVGASSGLFSSEPHHATASQESNRDALHTTPAMADNYSLSPDRSLEVGETLTDEEKPIEYHTMNGDHITLSLLDEDFNEWRVGIFVDDNHGNMGRINRPEGAEFIEFNDANISGETEIDKEKVRDLRVNGIRVGVVGDQKDFTLADFSYTIEEAYLKTTFPSNIVE